MSRGYLKKCSTGLVPKIQHATQAAAEGQRSGMIAAGRWTRGNSNTYFCNQCGWYHAGKLGRSNRGKGRKVAAKNLPRHLATQ
jgi:predicted RNA-binding Zn-ribbon protein involved in translation (DUF1610 family)